jgi:hypothetical protein
MVLVVTGCSAQTMIITNTPDAKIFVDGRPLVRNVLTYGRWIGNTYNVKLTAPGFKTQEMEMSPHLGDRAGALAIIYFISVIGVPLLPSVFWNGEFDSRVYISMEPNNDKTTQ